MNIGKVKSLIDEYNFLEKQLCSKEFCREVELNLKVEYDDIKIYELNLSKDVLIFKGGICISYILPCDGEVMFENPSDWIEEMEDDINNMKKLIKERQGF